MHKTHAFCVHILMNGQNPYNLEKIHIFNQIKGRKYVVGTTNTIDYTLFGKSLTNFSLKYHKMDKIAQNLIEK